MDGYLSSIIEDIADAFTPQLLEMKTNLTLISNCQGTPIKTDWGIYRLVIFNLLQMAVKSSVKDIIVVTEVSKSELHTRVINAGIDVSELKALVKKHGGRIEVLQSEK